jgi:hypothetical protein
MNKKMKVSLAKKIGFVRLEYQSHDGKNEMNKP